MRSTILAVTALLVGALVGASLARSGSAPSSTGADARPNEEFPALTETAQEEILALARLLQRHPTLALDFTHLETPQYCLNTGADMLHVAVEPDARIPLFFMHPAEPFLAAGLDVSVLPTEPATLEELEPETWYYYPADGSVEPLHGKPLGVPMLVRTTASDPSPRTWPAPGE